MKILIVGNFNYGPNFRGIQEFFRSFGPMFDYRFTFFIIGKCNKEEALMDAIKCGYQNFKVERIYYADRMDIYYKQVDFCLNYVNYGSGENVKMIEALTFGRPIINTGFGDKKLNELFSNLGLNNEFKPTITIEDMIKSKMSCYRFLLNVKVRLYNNLIIFEKLYLEYCMERSKEFKLILDNCG
jgi:hypothetical protein